MLGRLSFRGRHLLLLDVIATTLAFLGSFALRFDAPSPLFNQYLRAYAWVLPLLVVARIAAFIWLRLYQRVWRYASVEELLAVVIAVASSSPLVWGIAFGVETLSPGSPLGFPRSVPIIDSILAITLAGLWRFALLLLHGRRVGAHNGDALKRALVVGGQSAAIGVLRELRSNPALGFVPVGVVADDYQRGQRLMGVPVLGGLAELKTIADRESAEVVVLALPSANGSTLRNLVRAAEDAGARCLTVPSIAEVMAGRVSLNALREVDLEDLLRRAPARIDIDAVAASFRGRRILVTGAGGSIGGELVRQLVRLEPAEIVLLGRGENSIFEILQSLPSKETRLIPAILDVRDGGRLDSLIAEFRPHIVFHAAAHKHVALMEMYPEAAADTNILGTWKLLTSCIRHNVAQFVFISSDKAVNPSSVMGATKRAAELLVLWAAQSSGHAYSTVRFGNVLSSRGSVVPLFRREIEAGRPIRITHPDVARYFMTIPEAVQLVLQAAVLATGSDVFVLDMGEPVKILDLADSLVRLHGLELGKDVLVEYSGLQPGEKLIEELFFPDETRERTTHEAITRVRAQSPLSDIAPWVDALSSAVATGDRPDVLRWLSGFVPEYRPSQAARRLLGDILKPM